VTGRRRCSDAGLAGLWTLWAAVVVLSACLAVLAWAAAIVARQRAEAAADLAALAAARALVAGAAPCPAGVRVATAAGARMVGCAAVADSVTVVVEVSLPRAAVLGLDVPPARARARAGVPP
jgi:secretion/DNA translocation related TadE-like protein